MEQEAIEISREDYEAYEEVRASGKTNMFAVNVVCDLSGLTRPKVMAIMKQYGELEKKYPGVRDEAMRNHKCEEEEEDEDDEEDE